MVNSRYPCGAALFLAAASLLSCSSNHAPEVPARPAGPDYCFKDSTYVFTAVASDPDGDSVAVRFDWGDSTASHWQSWFASGETVEFTHAWTDTGTFYLRVSAQDQKLLTSEPSDSLAVRVAIRWPPETPSTPAGPNVGGIDTSYSFVAGADHPDGIDVAIRFAWGDGDTSDWSEFVPSAAPVSAKHAWSWRGTFSVTAQAKDTGNVMSPWSLPHDVTVGWPGSLVMVGAPVLTPDSSGFLICCTNSGSFELTVSFLRLLVTPDYTYMRDFRIDSDHCGYPIPDGMPGTGPGDAVHFTAPVTIAPGSSQLVELYFGDFHADSLGVGSFVNVHGKEVVFRFSNGSVITVCP